MERKFIYITYGSVYENSVFKTQVMDLINDLHKEGLNFHLFMLTSLKNIFNKNIKSDKVYLKENIKSKFNHIYIAALKPITIYLAAIFLFITLLKNIIKRDKIIVHCRGEVPVLLANTFRKFYKNTEIIYDKRGLVLEEYIYECDKEGSHKSQKLMNFYEYIQKLSVLECRNIFCVSNNMKKHLLSKYDAQDKVINVVPCCASLEKFYFDNDERNKLRDELGISDKTVFIYSGSLYKWQMIDKVVDVIKALSLKLDNIFLLICTAGKPDGIFDTLPESMYKVIKVNNEDMYKYYSAADFGMIFREPSIVNIVSSPVKIAEYACCRLPVIATSCIGDVDMIFSGQEEQSIILDSLDNIGEISCKIYEKISQSGFKISRISPEIKKYFDRKQYINIYKHIYFS